MTAAEDKRREGMTRRTAMCLGCAHDRHGLCTAKGCGLWWVPPAVKMDCSDFLPRGQTTMEDF